MREEPPTDFHLERWREGDDSAFRALHERFTPQLRARLVRSASWPALERHHESDDVLNEFWLRAVPAARDRFEHRGEGSLLGFLSDILEKQIVDLVRRQAAKKRNNGAVQRLATDFDAPDRGGPMRSAPVTPTSHARFGEIVQRAREKLPAHLFEVWHLREIQGLSNEEVAAMFGKTSAAIRSMLNRARTALADRGRGGSSE